MKGFAIGTLMFIASLSSQCDGTQSLNQGLQNEKSYTRRAMESYRKNPKRFQGDKRVLDAWSKSDYIAREVNKQKAEEIVDFSDRLAFLGARLQKDSSGKPFCVIRTPKQVVVLTFQKTAPTCSKSLLEGIDMAAIRSGDLEFSGRSDFWIYVSRTAD